MRDVIQPANLHQIFRRKQKNGDQIYMRYHALGRCYTDYKAPNDHTTLDGEEIKDFQRYIKEARETMEAYSQKRAP